MKKLYILLLMLLSTFSITFAQNDAEQIRKELSAKLGQNSMGTDFWFAMPEIFYKNVRESFYLVVTSEVDNEIEIKSLSKDINIRAKITAGRDTIIELYGVKYADYSYSTNSERIKTRITKNSGINIKSQFPVSVQTYNSYNGLKDASIAIPTNSLGNEFMLQTYFKRYSTDINYIFPPGISITAPYDDTRIELKLASYNKDLKIKYENGDSLIDGESTIVNLNKGDVWTIYSVDSVGDLSGSIIRSNNPVNVLYSQNNMSQPRYFGYSDEVHSTIFPTNTWGKTYVIPTYRELNEYPTIRIFTQFDSTNIYRNGIYWKTVNNSTSNEIFESKVWENRDREDANSIISPTIISSDNPTSIMVFPDYKRTIDSTIFEARNLNILTPLEQAVNYASFSLFSLDETSYFNETTGHNDETIRKLELYFELDKNEEIPSDIEFAIIDTNNSEVEWKPIKDYYGESYSAIQLNNKHIALKEIFLPDSCSYFIRSMNSKFSGYVYKLSKMFVFGISDYLGDFFGFPFGLGMNDLTSSDTKTPIVTLTKNSNGSKVSGIVDDNHDHTSKLAQLYMLEKYSYNFKYELISADKGFIADVNNNDFVAGEPVQLEFELTKINEGEDAFALIYTTDRAGNDTLVFVNEDKFTSIESDNSINEYIIITESEITLLPKAFKDGFTELTIFNLDGVRVRSFNTNENSTVSLENLTSGTYFIVLKGETKMMSRKVNLIK